MQRNRRPGRHRRATGSGPGFSAMALATALACAVAACGGGTVPRVGAPAGAVCPGVDVSTLRARYVSPQGSDDGLCGADAPCKTITAALALASLFGDRALVPQHGLYPTSQTIDLKGSISLYGSCLFNGEPDQKYRSFIQASTASGMPAIRADGVSVTVSGGVVIANDRSVGASIAMSVAQANVTLRSTMPLPAVAALVPIRRR